MLLPRFAVDDIITTALKEDIHYLDTTTDLMIPADSRSTARFLAKAEGVVCGMSIIQGFWKNRRSTIWLRNFSPLIRSRSRFASRATAIT